MAPIPLPVIPNTYRLALKWQDTVHSQTAVNVMHLRCTTSGSTSSDCFSALDSAVTTAMWLTAFTESLIQSVDITPLDGSTATTTFATPSGDRYSGGSGSEPVPQVACLVKFQTALRGRDNRGRIFIPFMGEANITAGTVSGTVVANMQTAWTLFLATLEEASPKAFNLVVAAYDRKHGGAGAHATNVTAAVVESLSATQRRRMSRLRGS